ncbi:hypothetical protein KJQ64_04915 [Campylobacter lari]|uniref:hypothetical protein n=3 Tax=Campylobacter lari TaxID=201 RepID=UPI00138E9F52|nr:hypothetical protein [Campylobacter lari]MBT0822092.1 hypothetical protein [Campylobacter lari]
MVSLAELKTGKEKLELINQILLRIDTIARALDNTRLDEIVGLKESVNSLHEQTLELKQEVLTIYTSFSENKKDFDTKFSSVNEKFSIMQERFSFIEQAYNDFSSSKEELELIKGFIEENKPVFESLKDDLSKYESMKIDLEAIITEATNNTKLSKEYFELSSKIKDDILRELEHCKDLVQELNYSADELRGLKPELLQIKKEVNELSSQASKVVLDASEIIKNKINTIFFENQRLNQEMIDGVKKLEEIKYDVGIKYKEIIQAYNLLLETKESLEELKEVIALYKEFENDIKSYSELIKNFKEQIANLESDLENKAQGLHEDLEAKGEQVISSIETAKNEAIVKFDELVAKCEGYKIHFEQSYDRFNQRALIANEDLGRLAEVAKKELGNDKLIYETELKALRDEILQEMNEVSDKVINDSTGVIASIDEKANELKNFVDISRANIDNLINAFNANYNQKIQEFTSLNTNALSSIEEAKTSSLSDINTSKDESISSIETSKDNALSSIEEAKTQGIASIDEKLTQIDFNGIKERVEKNEGDIAGIEESLENKADLLTRVESKTVGVGGDFTTIQECCDYYAKYIALKEVRVTVTLKRGYKWEKLRLVSCNLLFMDIKSEDEWIELADSKDYIIHLSNSIAPIMSNLKFRNTTGKRLAKLIYATNNSFMLAPNISFDIRDDYEDDFGHCVYSGYKTFLNISGSSIKVRLTKAKSKVYNILVSSHFACLVCPNPKIDFEDTFSTLNDLQLLLLLNTTSMSLNSYNMPTNSIKINIPKSTITIVYASNLTDIICEGINLDVVAKRCIAFASFEASRIQAVNIKNPKIRVTDTSGSYMFFAGGGGGYIAASLYVRGSSVDSKVIDTNITPNTIVEKGVIIK